MSFVDTNVLVHATVPGSPDQTRAQRAVRSLAGPTPVAISHQVLREYVAVMTRPQSWGAAIPLAQAFASASAFRRAFQVVEDGPAVWAALERLGQSAVFGGKQVHDANIVATMLAHGKTRLLTFNPKHFRRFAPLIEIVEP